MLLTEKTIRYLCPNERMSNYKDILILLEAQRDFTLSKILEAVDSAGLVLNPEFWTMSDKERSAFNKGFNAQLQAIKKAIGERECKGCKGNKVIPVSLIYGKINKVNERLCPNCNGTGKVTVEQAITRAIKEEA